METDERQPHAVVLPYPGQSHINPLLQLSLMLASSRGYQVTFVSTRGNYRAMTEAWRMRGVQSPEDRGIGFRIVTIPDDMLPERNMKNIFNFIAATRRMEEPFVELLERILVSPGRGSFIVSDSLLAWVAQVARRFNVPWIAFYPLPVAAFLTKQGIPSLLAAGRIPVRQDTVKNDEVVEIPGLPPLHPTDLPDFVKNSFGDAGYDTAIRQNEVLKNAAWIIVNSCEVLEGGEVAAAREQGFPRLVPVGPLLPAEFLAADAPSSMGITGALRGEDNVCLEWLDRQPPLSVLYVSFGSISSISVEEVENLLDGLVRSKEVFLWVLRRNLIANMSKSAWQSYVTRANKHGLVVSWAPQLKVLRHPSVSVFLTHCGWNSTLESICAGVPMICWPCFFEQRLNCKYVVDVWKVGIRIHEDRGGEGHPSGTRIAEVVKGMLKGELGLSTRTRIYELQAGCRKASNLDSFPKM